jgi:glycosyltransferase involved in cell wall biosynthesis
MPAQLQKAAKVLVMTEAVKQEILELYKINAEKIVVIPGAASDSSQALPWYEREYTKDKYAGGKDYFLFNGNISPGTNILSLIKAFSQFKKWQQSNMKLLLVGSWSAQTQDVMEQLESFRFREDVVLIEDPAADARAKMLAAAYAMIDPSQYAGFGMNFPDVMRSETPIICSDIAAFRETAGEAAAFFEAGNEDALAEMLKRIYKDESWRQELIDKGKEQAGQLHYDDVAARFWQEIVHVGKPQST